MDFYTQQIMKQQEMVKIQVHSMIDLITNSSSEIFVDSENSLKPAKELLQELLKINGSDKKVNEVFEISIELDRNDIESYLMDSCEYEDEDLYEELGLAQISDYKKRSKHAEKIAQEIVDGKRPMIESNDGRPINSYLKVVSKDTAYDKFLVILTKLLYSPEHQEWSN